MPLANNRQMRTELPRNPKSSSNPLNHPLHHPTLCPNISYSTMTKPISRPYRILQPTSTGSECRLHNRGWAPGYISPLVLPQRLQPSPAPRPCPWIEDPGPIRRVCFLWCRTRLRRPPFHLRRARGRLRCPPVRSVEIHGSECCRAYVGI